MVEFVNSRNTTWDVPTVEEERGDLKNGSFIVFAAPQITCQDVVALIEITSRAAFDTDEFQSRVAEVGVTPECAGSEDVTDLANRTAEGPFTELGALIVSGILSK